jgi:hypothetical protein
LATQWRFPGSVKDWNDLRSSLLQASESVVLARIDSCGASDAQTVACTALEYFKGGQFPTDRFTYFDSRLTQVAKGEKYLLFLSRSPVHSRVLAIPPFRYRVADDDRSIDLVLYSTSWPSYRDSIVSELATLTPSDLASTADYVIRGTITNPQLVGSTQGKYGSLGVRVRTSYTTTAAADSNSVVLLDFPSGKDAFFKWFYLPPLTPEQDVILFLDRAPSGHFTLHGGLYGMWSVGGDSARVYCPTPYTNGARHALAAMPTDSLLGIIHKR